MTDTAKDGGDAGGTPGGATGDGGLAQTTPGGPPTGG